MGRQGLAGKAVLVQLNAAATSCAHGFCINGWGCLLRTMVAAGWQQQGTR
jgi:hypothetical protein